MRWAYIREIWDFDSTIEIEEKHTGRYGAKGQEREEKVKIFMVRAFCDEKIYGSGHFTLPALDNRDSLC